MRECRYITMCGRQWSPRIGPCGGDRCWMYSPMPDVEALEELADEIDLCGRCTSDPEDRGSFERWSRRIREALGVEK